MTRICLALVILFVAGCRGTHHTVSISLKAEMQPEGWKGKPVVGEVQYRIDSGPPQEKPSVVLATTKKEDEPKKDEPKKPEPKK